MKSYLGNLSKGSSLLSEVDDNTASAFLGFLNCLLDPKREIWAACADIGAENVAAVTLIIW